MTTIRVLSSLAILMFALPAQLFGYTLMKGNPRWQDHEIPVPWILNENRTRDMPFEELEAQMIESFAVWNRVSCSFMQWRYEGTTTKDYRNWSGYADGPTTGHLMAWQEDSWPPDMNGAIAVTAAWYNPGEFLDADILFNGYHFVWCDAGPDCMDVQHIAVHEIGHALGLDHSGNSDASMYAYAWEGDIKNRTLHEDDINGVCAIYPATGTGGEIGGLCDEGCLHNPDLFCSNRDGELFCTGSCEIAEDCPDGFRCSDLNAGERICEIEGDGGMAEPCISDATCQSAYFCRGLENTNYCTLPCPTECPDGYECFPSEQGDEVCLEEMAAVGEPCDTLDCQPGLICHEILKQDYCVTLCNDDFGCPESEVCASYSGENVCWSEHNPNAARLTWISADPPQAVVAGRQVRISAQAADPATTLFQFLAAEGEKDPVELRGFKQSESYIWQPQTPGAYTLIVRAVSTKSEASFDEERSFPYEVKDPSLIDTDDVPDWVAEGRNDAIPTGSSQGCAASGSSIPLFLLILLAFGAWRVRYRRS